MDNIKMIKTFYKLNSNNEFEIKEQEARTIDDEWYNNIIEAKEFFLSLGGQEIHKKKQTKRGSKVTQVISISPDGTMKSVYDFNFDKD